MYSTGRISIVQPALSGTSRRVHRKTTRRARISRTPRPASQVRVHTQIACFHTLTPRSDLGVFLNYDISPILIVHDEVRQSFAHFLTSYVPPVSEHATRILTRSTARQDVRDCRRGAHGCVAHRQRAFQRDSRAEASWTRGASGILQREAHVIRIVVGARVLCIALDGQPGVRQATSTGAQASHGPSACACEHVRHR